MFRFPKPKVGGSSPLGTTSISRSYRTWPSPSCWRDKQQDKQSNMPIDSVKTKLHEARSALNGLRDEEQKAAGEAAYGHRLVGFLSAARSVDYRLRCEYQNTYPDWRKQWNAQHPAEDGLLIFINSKRADDVHKRGSGRTVKAEEIKVGTGTYSDKGGKVVSFG